MDTVWHWGRVRILFRNIIIWLNWIYSIDMRQFFTRSCAHQQKLIQCVQWSTRNMYSFAFRMSVSFSILFANRNYVTFPFWIYSYNTWILNARSFPFRTNLQMIAGVSSIYVLYKQIMRLNDVINWWMSRFAKPSGVDDRLCNIYRRKAYNAVRYNHNNYFICT